MIHGIRRSSLAVIVGVTLLLTCAVPVLAQAGEEQRSVWTAFSDWLVGLSYPLGTWAKSDRESDPLLDSDGLTEPQPPDAMSDGGDGGPDSTNDTAPFIDPDG